MIFDRIAILDWSAAKGPKRGKDSIWLAKTAGEDCDAQNHATRSDAERALGDLMAESLSCGDRLLLGVDFAFGAPAGFIAGLTGQATALSWWSWLAARITETPQNISNYRNIAAEMNGHFPGDGPFWGNGEKAQIPGLPRLKPDLPPGLRPYRATDLAARAPGASPKPVWQLAGAGAVGAQVLTGIPVLERLRHRFADHVSVWPFQSPTRPIVMTEVYPSLLADPVRALQHATGMVTDEAQVRLLATALRRLDADAMGHLFTLPYPAPEEGWILGAGQADRLRNALG